MLDKKYNHKIVEENKYDFWLDKKYFESGDLSKEAFCIVIPPPNITGKLHLGHAWDTALQDIIIRYKKLCGYDVLWVPGMDHAGIATQAKIDKKLKDMGKNPRQMKREEWLKHAWDWKEEYSSNIRSQWAKLGLALDYTKERFTMDEGLSNAVKEVFVRLYNEGLIYRGERIINWDPEALTALSNEEVIYKEVKGAFYHIKYMIEDSSDYLEVATTRPETLFGDTAVAVNPNDERYKHLIGKNVILPILDKKIPVIGDEHADMEFGTGIVKITPAHDPNDFEVGNRHNLERIVVINPNGTMNKNAGKYEGLDRFECRKELIKDLEVKNLLIEVEDITHNVGHSERTGVMIEPYLSKQWFVKMRPLADRVLENQKDKESKVNFVPARFEKIMNHWMEITYDWCISRQLWGVHRIPAWYREDEVYVGREEPKGDGWVQDEDVLDTWFSSALWPFSTLGWPENTKLLQRYYPNNVLVTGYDIIPFWVNRMTFQGLHFTGKRPFKECLIHGLIRDKEGRKFSKSLGNGIDPMDMIELYGSDALRYYLTTNSSRGMDFRFDEDKMKSTWNFINKLWNASRFVLLNLEDFKEENFTLENLSLEDKWILTKLNKTIKNVRKNMDKYMFNEVGSELYSFIWDNFCDSYIEFSKFNLNNTTKSVLHLVLKSILQMLHPFIPFVTEEIYQKLPINKESIMISSYPIYNKKYIFDEEAKEIECIINEITNIRNFKVSNKITKDSNTIIEVDKKYESIFKNILKVSDEIKKINNSKKLEYNSPIIKVTFEIENKEDDVNIKEKLLEEKNKLIVSIEKRKKLLSNENYINKAPKNIVDLDREKLKEEEERLKIIEKELK
ncbi:MAG: valine--tRNA ligase [Bacilli bacterium]|nr:valine--tRNA ligase [Bacilli bacterium]